MKIPLLALILLGSTACRTTEAASDVKYDAQSTLASKELPADGEKGRVAGYTADLAKSSEKSPAVQTAPAADSSAQADKESLLKWRVGRWSLVLKGSDAIETLDKPGSVACEVTAGSIKSHLGKEKLLALKTAIAEVSKVKDQRQISPIFRGLDKSRELVAVINGQEFLIEKMYQSRDAIMPDPAKNVGSDNPKPGVAESGLETIMEVAVNPAICPTIPN